jgi:hypothetical protein
MLRLVVGLRSCPIDGVAEDQWEDPECSQEEYQSEGGAQVSQFPHCDNCKKNNHEGSSNGKQSRYTNDFECKHVYRMAHSPEA